MPEETVLRETLANYRLQRALELIHDAESLFDDGSY